MDAKEKKPLLENGHEVLRIEARREGSLTGRQGLQFSKDAGGERTLAEKVRTEHRLSRGRMRWATLLLQFKRIGWNRRTGLEEWHPSIVQYLCSLSSPTACVDSSLFA